MTSIAILSDLHLEFGDFTIREEQAKADILILAGDIHTGMRGLEWAEKNTTNPLVIYVPGNHEYYHEDFDSLNRDFENYDSDRIFILNPGLVQANDVVIVGATLWTDFKLFGNAVKSQRIVADGMNDYHIVKGLEGLKGTEKTKDIHVKHAQFIENTIPGDKILVVTHHAPSQQSSHTRYRDSPLQPGYCSNMEGLIMKLKPALWVHGHIHDQADYMIGETRIVSNPRGYSRFGENAYFNPKMVIEL